MLIERGDDPPLTDVAILPIFFRAAAGGAGSFALPANRSLSFATLGS